MNNKETIKAAAIKRSDGIISIGKSHADIIKKSPYGTCKKGSISGFLTSKDRFVDKQEAAKIAILSGQIIPGPNLIIRSCGLLSENIWSDSNYKYDEDKGYYFSGEKDKTMKEREEKIKKIDEFLLSLKEFISTKAQDIVDSANVDCWDSMVGMSSYKAESNLEKSLYKLFNIEIEEENEEDKDNF